MDRCKMFKSNYDNEKSEGSIFIGLLSTIKHTNTYLVIVISVYNAFMMSEVHLTRNQLTTKEKSPN